jgi:hypothetical protein
LLYRRSGVVKHRHPSGDSAQFVRAGAESLLYGQRIVVSRGTVDRRRRFDNRNCLDVCGMRFDLRGRGCRATLDDRQTTDSCRPDRSQPLSSAVYGQILTKAGLITSQKRTPESHSGRSHSKQKKGSETMTVLPKKWC